MLYVLQVNFFSFIVLLFIYLQIIKNKTSLSYQKQYFLLVILSTAAVVFLDIILQFINGTDGDFLRNLHIFFVLLFYVLNPVPFYLWTALIWEYLLNDTVRKPLYVIAYSIPLIVFVIFSIISLFNQSLFGVSLANEYFRGPQFQLLTIVDSFYAIMGVLLVIYSYSKLLTNDLLVMLLSYLIPFIGGIIQAFNYGVYTLWPSVTISILLIYLFNFKENAFTRNIVKTIPNSKDLQLNNQRPTLWD